MTALLKAKHNQTTYWVSDRRYVIDTVTVRDSIEVYNEGRHIGSVRIVEDYLYHAGYLFPHMLAVVDYMLEDKVEIC